MNIPTPFMGAPSAGAIDPTYLGPDAEPARRAVLAQYDFEGVADDPELKAITDFVAKLCEAKTCLVSLVGTSSQHFVARTGLDATGTPRGQSFCQHAMVEERIMVVRDASQDPRFAANTLVTGAPYIRFYAGAPLISEEGAPLGALCVIDPEPRSGLTDLQREGMTVMAAAVMRRLSARRRKGEIAASTDAAAAALRDSERRFETLADAIPQLAWSTDAAGTPDYFNARWYEFTASKPGDHFGPHWVDLVHPDDREAAGATWMKAVAKGEFYEVEYRLRHSDGEHRWTLARGMPMKDGAGKVVRWFGSNTDIHDTKLLIESQELLSRELTHRIKNIFTVVSGLVSLASRAHPDLQDLAGQLADRIAALGRAHNYVRPISEEPASATTLSALLGDLFAPYAEDGKARVEIVGDDVEVGERGVTPLALAYHELATNAVKYGSLSAGEGRVRLTVKREGDRLDLYWKEENGPVVASPTERGRRGFGSDLLTLSVERQLKGAIEHDWQDDGLCVRISVPLDRLK